MNPKLNSRHQSLGFERFREPHDFFPCAAKSEIENLGRSQKDKIRLDKRSRQVIKDGDHVR